MTGVRIANGIRRIAAKSGTNSCKKLRHTERFGHIVVGARIEAADAVRDGIPSREDEDGRPALGPAELGTQREPVAIRQPDVERPADLPERRP